jgi:hypothetical protein
MKRRIWELHSQQLDGAIQTTPEGDADVGGLVFSEKAYLLVVRELRPPQLVELVRRDGPQLAAQRLVAHFATPEAVAASGGRALVSGRGMSPGPYIRRSDEVAAPVAPHL